MPLTVAEFGERVRVTPDDLEALLAMYPDDIEDLWSEGAPSDVAVADLELTLNPDDARIELGRPLTTQDRYTCPQRRRRLRWIEVHPPTDGWQECSYDSSRWRPVSDGGLRPAAEVEPPTIVHIRSAKEWGR